MTIVAPIECSPPEVREALDRILASKPFSRSERLAAFLRHIVEKELAGRGEEITELSVLVDVFGRKHAHPILRTDTSLARTEANRLRKKLAAYYAGPGRLDSIEIGVLPGGYRPRIAPRRTTSSDGRLLVLVSPIRSFAGDQAAEALAEDLTGSLTRALARRAELFVVGADSARLAILNPSLDDPASLFAASHWIDGEVEESSGNWKLRLRGRGRHGDETWTLERTLSLRESVDAGLELANRFATEALGLAAVLEPRIVDAAARPEAIALCQRGTLLLNRRSAAYLDEALRYFDAALALERQEYARAWAGRAEALALLSYASPDSPDSPDRLSRLAAAKESAARATSLDPGSWAAHAVTGMVACVLDWNLPRMEAALHECLAIDRARTESYYVYWIYLDLRGRVREALPLALGALERDPLSPLTGAHCAFVQLLAGEFEEAIETAARAKRWMSTFYLADVHVALAAIGARRWDLAYDHARRARALADGSSNAVGSMGFAAAKLGRENEARELLAEAIEKGESCAQIASVLVGLGRIDEACEWLERGIARHETILQHLPRIPIVRD